MENFKYLTPFFGALMRNNPYQSTSRGGYKPTKKELLYDTYQIVCSVAFVYCLTQLIKMIK